MAVFTKLSFQYLTSNFNVENTSPLPPILLLWYCPCHRKDGLNLDSGELRRQLRSGLIRGGVDIRSKHQDKNGSQYGRGMVSATPGGNSG